MKLKDEIAQLEQVLRHPRMGMTHVPVENRDLQRLLDFTDKAIAALREIEQATATEIMLVPEKNPRWISRKVLALLDEDCDV